jgi:hypothetical protein
MTQWESRVEIRDSRLCSARDETSCASGCRMVARGSSYYSPIFCFLKRERERKSVGCWGTVLSSCCFWLAGAGAYSQEGSLRFGVFVRVSVEVPLVAPERLISLEEELIESLVGGCRYAI